MVICKYLNLSDHLNKKGYKDNSFLEVMNDTPKYVSTKYAREKLNVSECTLRKWADSGIIPSIRTPKGTRMYDIDKYLRSVDQHKHIGTSKVSICYCRVSSNGQKEDLERQVDSMRTKYPNHRIITDIASGINFRRKGLKTILELTMSGNVEQVVVSYRDRLCRFAFELFEWLFSYHGVELVVLDSNLESSENGELAEDLLAIINVFNCRVNGKRKYKKSTQKEIDCGKEDEQEEASKHLSKGKTTT